MAKEWNIILNELNHEFIEKERYCFINKIDTNKYWREQEDFCTIGTPLSTFKMIAEIYDSDKILNYISSRYSFDKNDVYDIMFEINMGIFISLEFSLVKSSPTQKISIDLLQLLFTDALFNISITILNEIWKKLILLNSWSNEVTSLFKRYDNDVILSHPKVGNILYFFYKLETDDSIASMLGLSFFEYKKHIQLIIESLKSIKHHNFSTTKADLSVKFFRHIKHYSFVESSSKHVYPYIISTSYINNIKLFKKIIPLIEDINYEYQRFNEFFITMLVFAYKQEGINILLDVLNRNKCKKDLFMLMFISHTLFSWKDRLAIKKYLHQLPKGDWLKYFPKE